MALNLQMKTHPSSKIQNAHCQDIKKNLWEISVFICISSLQHKQLRERHVCISWAWSGICNTFYKGIKEPEVSLDKTMLCQFHIRDNLCCGVFKRIILRHYAKAINIIGGPKKKLHARDKIEDSSGIESYGYNPNMHGFLFQEKGHAAYTPSPHIPD